jgi:hypothetical protein
MPIIPDNTIRADDFINESEIPTPQSDAEGKVVKLESDGKIHHSFLQVKPLSVQEFTSSGTWTKPSSGTLAMVEMMGAGGGGACLVRTDNLNTATGGTGGAYRRFFINLTRLNSTESVVVGTGGAGITTSSVGTFQGNNGGNSSFKGVVATGGRGGTTRTNSSDPATDPVVPTGGVWGEDGGMAGNQGDAPSDALFAGSGGGGSFTPSSGPVNTTGATSVFDNLSVGGNGQGRRGANATATNGFWGAGGGGASVSQNASNTAISGAGGNGFVRVTVF